MVMVGILQCATSLVQASPCKDTDPPYKMITLTLDASGKLVDPGSTNVDHSAGKHVLIDWKAPNGWEFKVGSIAIKNDNPGTPQFSRGNVGIQPPPPGSPSWPTKSPYHHICDQNTVSGPFDYTITIYDENNVKPPQRLDPSLVNDGSGFGPAKRRHKNKK